MSGASIETGFAEQLSQLEQQVESLNVLLPTLGTITAQGTVSVATSSTGTISTPRLIDDDDLARIDEESLVAEFGAGGDYEYILMNLHELCALPTDILETAMRIGEPLNDVLAVSDRLPRNASSDSWLWDLTERHSQAIEAATLSWLAQSQPFDRVHAAYAGLLTSGSQIREIVLSMSNNLAQAHVETLGLQRPQMAYLPLSGELEGFRIENETQITSVENMERVLSTQHNTRWANHMGRQYQRMRSSMTEMTFDEYVRQLRARGVEHPNAISQTVVSATGDVTIISDCEVCSVNPISIVETPSTFTVATTSFATFVTTGVIHSPAIHNTTANTLSSLKDFKPRPLPYKIRKEKRRETKRARRALVKSMKEYAKFRNRKEVNTFIKGDVVEITGHLFNYDVSRKPHIRLVDQVIRPHNGVIPYRLKIKTKAGDEIASGCVYFADTPIIDQILILSLHVQDREEEIELMQKTIWSDTKHKDALFSEIIATMPVNPTRISTSGTISTSLASIMSVMESGQDWCSQSRVISQRIRPAVQAYVLSRLAIPLPVAEFMVEPPFNPSVLRDEQNILYRERYGDMINMIHIAMDIDHHPETSAALVEALIAG